MIRRGVVAPGPPSASEPAQAEDEEFAPDAAFEHALLADILRRSGQYDAAEAEYDEGLALAGDETLRRILEFGRKLCDAGDDRAHSVDEALDSA